MSKIFNNQIVLADCTECLGDGYRRNANNQIIVKDGRDVRCECYYANRFLEANIGYDYWFIEPDTFQGDPIDLAKITKYFNKVNELQATGRGFFIYGPDYGTGKTTLGTMFLKHVLSTTSRSALFVPFSDLVVLNSKLMNGSFDKTIDEKIEVIKNVDFLMLDDLAKEFDSQRDNGRATLNSILRYRDLWNKPTIYTANIPISQVSDMYGGSNYSIIAGRSIMIDIQNTEDFRRTRKVRQLIKERD